MGKSVWVLADHLVGSVNQSTAVAERLGPPFDVKRLVYKTSFRLESTLRHWRVAGPSLAGIDRVASSPLDAPWPDVVIACGRRTALVALWIKKQSRQKTFCVQVMDPGPIRSHLDLVALLGHDQAVDRGNTMRILGAPHRVTAERLAEEAECWRANVARLPSPWITVLVGGDSGSRTFTAERGEALADSLLDFAGRAGGTLLVTTSRRTPDAGRRALAARIGDPHQVFLWEPGRPNPYFGYLGLADMVVATGDSVSMCTEATATCKPLYLYAPADFTRDIHARFHASLRERGIARLLTPATEPENWTYAPVNPAQEVADEIRRRLGWDAGPAGTRD